MFRFIKILLLVVVSVFIIASPILAAPYSIQYTVTESASTTYTMLAVSKTANISYLVSNGYIQANALDTRIQTLGGIVKPHMVASDKILTAIPVAAGSTTNLYFTTDNSDLSAMDIIAGEDGYITIPDHASIELSNLFYIQISGYFDTTAGANKNIILKLNGANYAFKVWVSGGSEVSIGINNGAVVSVIPVIASGEHDIEISCDTTNLQVWLDGTLTDTDAIGANSVPDSADYWTLGQENSIRYLDYFIVSK